VKDLVQRRGIGGQSRIASLHPEAIVELAEAGQVDESGLRLRLGQPRNSGESHRQFTRITSETQVRLLRAAPEGEALREELGVQELRNQLRAFEVEHEQLLPRAQQELRRQMLPLEQAPQIVEAAAGLFHGANLSIYGENGPILGQLGPLVEILARAVRQATPLAGEASHDA
jgi:hypothetical protein